MEQCEGVIAFHHVNFRYPGATEDVLSDIDLLQSRERPLQLSEVPDVVNLRWSTCFRVL